MIERESITLIKIVYKPEGATRCKSVIMKNPTDLESFFGEPAVTGVNFQNPIQTHIISSGLIVDRFEVVQDLMYGGFKKKK